MFKTVAFACAALAVASAQNLQDLANQVAAVAAPVLNQAAPVVQHGDSISLNVNDYEWTLTEFNGEYELNVNQLATNANNLAPTLSALLANVGAASQGNNDAIGNILDAEAASVGVDIENSAALADAASQYGAQLADNSSPVAQLAGQQYSNVAAALASNANGITDQVNNQINEAVNNNQASLSNAVSTGVNAAINNVGYANNIPSIPADSLPAGIVPLANAALNTANSNQGAINNALNNAGSVNANQAAADASNLASQAINAGVNAANNNLASNVANSVQGAASSVADSAATSLSSAASTLNANNVDNLNSAAALVANSNQ